jgi:hypothetical protein
MNKKLKMKKNIIIYILIASVFFAACEKNDGPVSKEIALERVPAPLIVKDATSSAAIDMTNLAGFNGKVNISLYFPNDIPPLKFDIVVRKNNNNGNVKLFQAGVTSFPKSITITAAQIATLFGTPITLGDNYDIGADAYAQSGKKYEAFPVIGLGYAAAFQPDHPGFSPSVRFSAICQYNASLFPTGNYVVLQDDWQDYFPGDVITVTQIDATHLSFRYLAPTNNQPIIVTINPTTNVTSVAKQVYGDYPWNTFGNLSVNTVASNDNVVAPCNQSFGVFLAHTVSIGSYGTYLIRLKKQ